MPRIKKVKRTPLRQTSSNKFASIQKTEQGFAKTPFQLITQIEKEIKTLKRQEAKLKILTTKINQQTKTAEGRFKIAAKNKLTTPANRKQIALAKKSYEETLKTQTGLTKELATVSTLLESFTKKHAKLTALAKNLTQFEKDWSKNAKLLGSKTSKTKLIANKIKAEKKTKKTQIPSLKAKIKPVTAESFVNTYTDFKPSTADTDEESFDQTEKTTDTIS